MQLTQVRFHVILVILAHLIDYLVLLSVCSVFLVVICLGQDEQTAWNVNLEDFHQNFQLSHVNLVMEIHSVKTNLHHSARHVHRLLWRLRIILAVPCLSVYLVNIWILRLGVVLFVLLVSSLRTLVQLHALHVQHLLIHLSQVQLNVSL